MSVAISARVALDVRSASGRATAIKIGHRYLRIVVVVGGCVVEEGSGGGDGELVVTNVQGASDAGTFDLIEVNLCQMASQGIEALEPA